MRGVITGISKIGLKPYCTAKKDLNFRCNKSLITDLKKTFSPNILCISYPSQNKKGIITIYFQISDLTFVASEFKILYLQCRTN